MLTLVPLCFLFNWMLSADSMAVPFRIPLRGSIEVFSLSMVEDSVDDMYFGCGQEMMEEVQSHYLEDEMQDEFKDAWLVEDECAGKKPREEDKTLTKDHMRAICVYTNISVHRGFNKAVRKQGPVYGNKFKFHSLHFLLTSAIQILNSKNHCYTTYRRSKDIFTGHVNQRVRFGFFASSSYRTDLFHFGHQTCFKIKTCSGAYLRHYPAFGVNEEEVLIPPYETFNVTKIVTGPQQSGELNDCKVVYELESTGAASRLNCRAVYP